MLYVLGPATYGTQGSTGHGSTGHGVNDNTNYGGNSSSGGVTDAQGNQLSGQFVTTMYRYCCLCYALLLAFRLNRPQRVGLLYEACILRCDAGHELVSLPGMTALEQPLNWCN